MDDHLKSSQRTNLPATLTSFIGRKQELAAVDALLSAHRLITLTGVGGSGKTRLGIEVARGRLGRTRDGVWFVELAALTDPTLVPQSVATVLGVREQPGVPVLEPLVHFLHPREMLLILDNCEHLITASATLSEELLKRCPAVQILATSREPLGLLGETMYRVPALATPEIDNDVTVAEARSFAAVQLFSARAEAASSGFVLSDANVTAVAQICRRLDGIPLALELAAARVKVLGVESLATRLDDRFRLLTSGSRTALPRHRTLRGLIDWSFGLLTEPERALFARLSVFAGGWTLEAAEWIGGDGLVGESDVIDVLSQLVDKELVTTDAVGREPRFGMLETIREYALEQLHDRGDAEAAYQAHAAYYLALAEQADAEIQGVQNGCP